MLAKAGSQAVTFAIRSGVSLASTYAIRTITRFVTQIPKEDAKRLDILKSRLQNKIEIVTSAIELIKLVAARGNTNLESTLRLTSALENEVSDFDERITEMNSKLDNASSLKEKNMFIHKVEKYMQDLMLRIDEITPFINLALTTSGANLSTAMPKQVSPGLLLQASNFVNESNKKRPLIKGARVQVGPTFEVTVYSIFYNLNKNDNIGKLRVIWQESMKKAMVKIHRVHIENEKYSYLLTLEQDFNDGRYHNTEDGEETPQRFEFNITQIVKLFFSVSGKLLRLEEFDLPVLVLKIDKNVSSTKESEISSTENIEWLAMGGYDMIDVDSSDSESISDSNSKIDNSLIDNENSKDSTGLNLKKSRSGSDTDNDEFEDAIDELVTSPLSSSVALMEYILRLISLQNRDQKSILEVNDERLAIYLNDENPNGIRRVNNVDDITKRLQNVELGEGPD